MLRWIVAISLRYRYLVVFLAAALMVFGIIRLSGAAVDVFPEFAPPKVEIQTISLGLSATDVEELVTVPLENALNGVPGLDVMRSRSVPDLSDIILIFKPGTDVIFARQVVALVDSAGLAPSEWQSLPLLVNPPSLNVIAVTLLVELHGRMGYFPPVVRLRMAEGAMPPRFEVAEVINLQELRQRARARR